MSLSSRSNTDGLTRSAQEYLDMLALNACASFDPPRTTPLSTPAEKKADKARRLAARSTKHRFVFSVWPRDPKGEVILPENSHIGKMAPNGIQHWGETLFDFYYTRRIPDVPVLKTISTASKMAGWCKKQGELEWARDQLRKAELEGEPREVNVWGVGEALREVEETRRSAEDVDESKGKERVGVLKFAQEQPFNKSFPVPKLQARLDLHALPQRLVVHDPFRTLDAVRRSTRERPWDSEPDVVSVYNLTLSPKGQEKLDAERKTMELDDGLQAERLRAFLDNPTAEARPLDRGVLFFPTGTPAGPCAPAVFFMHEAKPRLGKVGEAHLYLSPEERAGLGNHSVLYNAEWEVPTEMLVDPVICKKCVLDRGMDILKMEDGEDGELKDAKWMKKSGRVEETVKVDPGIAVQAVTSTRGDQWRDEDGKEYGSFEIVPPSRVVSRKYHGPVRVINTQVAWQSASRSNFCEHTLSSVHPPYTSPLARVWVVAKLGMEDDRHLAREAQTYQAFPDHFFRHYNGYNILPPLNDPVPVGALVPQFYGYYVPDDSEYPRVVRAASNEKPATGESEGTKPYRYRSPLLLIENCGTSVCDVVDEMTIDDRQHCASLYFRMHHAGWVHNSAYTRNILHQPGPLSSHPLLRQVNAREERADLRKTSFRLIDFGRSEEYAEQDSGQTYRSTEEQEVVKTFKILHMGFGG